MTLLSVAYFSFFLGKIPGHLYESMARAMGENVDALAMARTMVSTQQAEIGQMNTMLEGTP